MKLFSLSVKPGLLQNEIKLIQQRWKMLISFKSSELQIAIARSALFAHHGFLGSVREIHLQNVDLSSVPAEHLTSLASCVTEDVRINNVRGRGLASFLDGLKCQNLVISCQSLGIAETEALIQATESRVKNVDLKKEVSLECLKSLPEIAWSANLAHQGLLDSFGEIHLGADTDLSSVPANKLASLASRVKNVNLEYDPQNPRLSDIIFAAKKAHQGRHTLEVLHLKNVDLSSVPTEHLMSLVSCVSETVTINHVGGCDMVNIMNSLKCKLLGIPSQNLSDEETLGLVQAMETRVEVVELGDVWGRFLDVKLDINHLTRYSGLGRCGRIIMGQSTQFGADHQEKQFYIKNLKTWARSKNWRDNHQTFLGGSRLLQIDRNEEGPVSEQAWREKTRELEKAFENLLEEETLIYS